MDSEMHAYTLSICTDIEFASTFSWLHQSSRATETVKRSSEQKKQKITECRNGESSTRTNNRDHDCVQKLLSDGEWRGDQERMQAIE